MATPSDTSEYLNDFVIGAADNHGLATAFATMVFGAFGGYMLTAVPNKVLLLWETFPFQFLTCLVTFAIDSIGQKTPWWVIIADSLLVSLCIQLFVRITQKMEGTVFEKSDTFPVYDALSIKGKDDRPLHHLYSGSEDYEPQEDYAEDYEPQEDYEEGYELADDEEGECEDC